MNICIILQAEASFLSFFSFILHLFPSLVGSLPIIQAWAVSSRTNAKLRESNRERALHQTSWGRSWSL